VKAADLVDTLSGKGPFTVFAPTNEVFADIKPGVDRKPRGIPKGADAAISKP